MTTIVTYDSLQKGSIEVRFAPQEISPLRFVQVFSPEFCEGLSTHVSRPVNEGEEDEDPLPEEPVSIYVERAARMVLVNLLGNELERRGDIPQPAQDGGLIDYHIYRNYDISSQSPVLSGFNRWCFAAAFLWKLKNAAMDSLGTLYLEPLPDRNVVPVQVRWDYDMNDGTYKVGNLGLLPIFPFLEGTVEDHRFVPVSIIGGHVSDGN